MNKKKKTIIVFLLFFAILTGLCSLNGFSPLVLNFFQNAVAHNEVLEEKSDSSQNTEDLEMQEDISGTDSALLGYEDTTLGISAGSTVGYTQVKNITDVDSEKEYSIIEYEDWKKLAELSKTNSLEGKVFWIYYPNNIQGPWKLNEIESYQKEGIGSMETPFAGTLKPFMDNVTINTSVPLFYALSSKASIGRKDKPLTINNTFSENVYLEKGVAGGLATNFVLETPETAIGGENSILNKIKVTGNLETTKNCIVGGLFGKVVTKQSSATLTLSKDLSSVDLSTVRVQGSIAGGLFGEVSGEQLSEEQESLSGTSNIITIKLLDMPSVAAKVIAVDPSKPSDFIGNNAYNENICAGGLIGRMTNQVVLTMDKPKDQNTPYMIIGNEVGSAGISGGLVGMVKNSAVTISHFQKDSTSPASNVEPYIYATYVCGGFIGMADSSVIELDDLVLNVDVKAFNVMNTNYYSSAGGIIGRYVTADDDAISSLKIADVQTIRKQRVDMTKIDYTKKVMVYGADKKPSNNTAGGIIGSCNGNNVQINNIVYSTDENITEKKYGISLIYAIGQKQTGLMGNSVNYFNMVENTGNESISGGIAGSIAGMGIEISDITFDFQSTSNDSKNNNSLGGYYVGDIAGIVGYDQNLSIHTKMKVSNITVKNNYTHKATKYHGGLFGYVGKGAIICLAGKIDLSKVPFFYLKVDSRFQDWSDKESVMLAPKGYRGFVAGYAEESLIYLDVDATISRSIKKDENGELVTSEIINDKRLNPDNGVRYGDCIDDIGNAGSVLINLKDGETPVINYSNAYGAEVTGKINKNKDGKYVISSLADALRLAAAGQAYDKSNYNLMFASKCFGEGVSIQNLLEADYIIATDLDLGQANIHSFLRNDSELAFSGTMVGQKSNDTKPVITISSISKQVNGGLYPALKSQKKSDSDTVTPVEFRNLIIQGQLYYHGGDYSNQNQVKGIGSGSIAAKAEGSCVFQDVEVTTKIKGDLYDYMVESAFYLSNYKTRVNWNENMFSHGGLVGEYRLNGGTLTVNNCNISPEISVIRSNCFVGGMIGRVDTSGKGSINIDGVTLGTKIVSDKNYLRFNTSSNINSFHGRTAGMIAFIGDNYRDVSTLNNASVDYDKVPAIIKDETYVTMNVKNITITDAKVDFTNSAQIYLTSSNQNSTNQYMGVTGGLLGYAWCNADVNMENITVQNCSVHSLGYVGGLVSFAAGKFDVSNVTLNGFTMNSVDAGSDRKRSYSGLLFGDGEYAFITLNKYTITDPTTVKVTNYTNFDEILGANVQRVNDGIGYNFTADIVPEYRHGGILNIIDENFKFDENYDSYKNQIINSTNKYTRYYYNLFVSGENDELWKVNTSTGALEIDSPEKLMTWHVGNYANETLTHFMAPYFVKNSDMDVSYRGVKTVNINTDLDMKGYSLYPTSVNDVTINGNNKTITLYGKEISDYEASLKNSNKSLTLRSNDYVTNKSERNRTQHYLMHASLLYCAHNPTVTDVIFKGSIANNDINSGAVVGGYVTGNVIIKNITFSGLKISHYPDLTSYDKCGLMLGWVGVGQEMEAIDTNATIDGIKMTGYTDSDEKSVASSLIAKAGNDGAKNIQISFENMQVLQNKEDVITKITPFKDASFIYDFNYSSDSMDNKSYGIYTFNYEDTVNAISDTNERDDNNVTYGQEIQVGVNYNDYFLDSVPGAANPLKEAIVEAETKYIPYIKENKGIYVNPKNGNIEKGCGTYEDPYIIDNPAQLLTLYCYLSGEKEVYSFLFKPGNIETLAWKVVPIGGDGVGDKCSSVSHGPISYGAENFPTVDDMRTAYYMIDGDIDLIDAGDLNFSTIINQFSGLGSYKYPFSGVIIGKQKNDNTFPVLTLPAATSKNYSFIEYMQGAVVKDLIIKNSNEKSNEAARLSSSEGGVSGGGVAAIVLGGDNIIDNVVCTLNIKVQDEIDGVGGYVGVIENGSLIIRNIPTIAIKDWTIQSLDGTRCYVSTDSTQTISNNKVGLLVGTVKDGFVLYDNDSDNDKAIFTNDNLNVTGDENKVLALINGFQLINGAYLDARSGLEGNRIQVVLSENNNEVKIANEAQLEIMALALNSDSLSVYIDPEHVDAEKRTNHLSGYDYTAKSRKAKYSEVGTEKAKTGGSSDCDFARTYDDEKGTNANALYPYLCYKYMNFVSSSDSGNSIDSNSAYQNTLWIKNEDGKTKVISKLNKADDLIEDVKKCTTTYLLSNENSDYVYDLSLFGNSFRGFGGLYSKEYSDFRANFDGNNHQVKIAMNRDWTSDIYITGMFNSLIYDTKSQQNPLTIKNLTITDSTFENNGNAEYMGDYSDDDLQIGAARGAATGALAGEVQGKWTFSEIKFQRTEDLSSLTNQGILATALNSEISRDLVCGVRGYMNVGGLIGRVNVTENRDSYNTYSNADVIANSVAHNNSNKIILKNCSIEGVSLDEAVNIKGKDNAFAVGGLIGSVGANINMKDYFDHSGAGSRFFYFGDVTFEDCSVTNAKVLAKNSGFLGGFAGTIGYRPGCMWRSVGSVQVTSSGSSYNNIVESVVVRSYAENDIYDNYSAGGIFGQVEVLAANPLVKDSNGSGERNTEMETFDKEGHKECQLIGVKVNKVTVFTNSKNEVGENAKKEISCNTLNNSNGIGGLIGYLNCRMMEINHVLVQDSSIGVYEKVTNGETVEYTSNTDVGGLIGRSSSNGEYCSAGSNHLAKAYYTNFLLIQDTDVQNSKIKSNQKGASVGGFIGYLSTDVMKIIGSSEVSSVKGNTIISYNSGYAGGMIGKDLPSNKVPTYNQKTFYSNKWIENVTIINNDIRSLKGDSTSNDWDLVAYAGGLIGYFRNDQNYLNRLTLEKIQIGFSAETNENKVTGNLIVGEKYAGGLCGCVDKWTEITYKDYVKVGSLYGENTIIASCSGGFYGKNISWNEVFETNQNQICNNQIIAVAIQKDKYTISGGVAAIRDYYSNMTSTTSTYTVKNNLIITTSRTNTKSMSYCGGIFGMLRVYDKKTQYYDQLVLKDNSIGYYVNQKLRDINSWDEMVKEIKTLNLSIYSRDVLLFGPTDANWRTININETNVGDYSLRIGNFFGDISTTKEYGGQCVILRPTLEYSKNIGSIPAVDVGQKNSGTTGSVSNYGYGYPYDYKSNCHIVYFDDYESSEKMIDISTDNDGIKPKLDTSVLLNHNSDNNNPDYEKEYFFGNMEKIVSDYEKVKNQTVNAENPSDTTYAFLTSKRLNITMGGDQNENLICASPEKDDYFSKTYVNDPAKYNSVPVIEVDGQSAQYIGDYVAAILTNGGGVTPNFDSNGLDDILDVSVVNAYIKPDGTISLIDVSAPEAIQAHSGSSISTVEESNQLTSDGCPFDEAVEINGDMYYTISLLRYTYTSYQYNVIKNGNTIPYKFTCIPEKETIYIPVFVTKKVTMNSYLSILPGEEYSLKEALNNGYKDQVVISHDSVYTIYAEFVYDEVRKEPAFENLKVEKALKFEQNMGDYYAPSMIQSGTKFTLVDAQTGEEFYYTAGENVSEIPFSEFTKGNGENVSTYHQRDIGAITITANEYKSIGYQGVDESERKVFADEVGLERYFIVVEPSGKDNNIGFRLSIATKVVNGADQEKEELVRKFLNEGINITQIFGPLISFEGVSENESNEKKGTPGVTEIEGKISKDKTLSIDGRIRISLVPENTTDDSLRKGSPYWDYKAKGNTIDSSNSGKYLEIGVTLIDNNTHQEVNWPEGTNVIINGDTRIPLQGNSVVYAYKDDDRKFPFDSLAHNISDGEWYYYDISTVDGEIPNYQWITKNEHETWYYRERTVNSNGNVTFTNKELGGDFIFSEKKVQISNQCHLEFDFSAADIKEYAGKSYTVKMNLYRSSDPDFPLEEAGMEILDGSIREYSKTIQAEGQYELAASITPDDLLDLGINLYGNTKKTYEIPFTNKLDFSNVISDNDEKAKKDIEVYANKYYMVTYRIYKKINAGNGNYEYVPVLLNDQNSPFTLYELNGATENSTGNIVEVKQITNANDTTEYVYQITKRFTEAEIRTGTANADGTAGTPYVTSWKMKLSVDSSKLNDEDLANYKIEVKYTPYDNEAKVPASDEASDLTDYFIFTIAKLKTDF